MTPEIDYSFINVNNKLSIGQQLMNRAVRVKQTVKDKLSRIYSSKVVETKPNVSVESKPVENVTSGIEFLIDLSSENVNNLNSKIDGLVKQNKVETKANRVVLFTGNLLNKIKTVASKWFPKHSENKTEVEEKQESVIPATWSTVETKVEETPVIPEFNMNVKEEAKDNNDFVIPFIPQMNPFDMQNVGEAIENSNVEVPENTPIAEENKELPVETKEPVQETNTPVVEEKQETTELKSEYVEEPKEITDIKVEEKPLVTPVTEETTELPVETKEPVQEISAPVVETREEPEISQSLILARLQRVNTTMKEKDSQIARLEGKVDSLSQENKTIKEKLGQTETQVKELSSKNAELEEQNSKLSSSNSNMSSSYEEKIKSLTDQLNEVSETRRKEHETSKNEISQLKEAHEREIEELKRKHAEEIQNLTAANERKISSIYKTIADALGETPKEEKTI